MYVFNEDVARLAIRMALPTIRMMAPLASWGPMGVVIGIEGPDFEEPVIYVMGELEKDPENSDRIDEFRKNVLAKLRPAVRTGRSSGHMLHIDPADFSRWYTDGLEGNDSLYRGSAVLGSIRAAASGFKQEADEYVAWVVLHCAMFICLMISRRMQGSTLAFVGDAYPSAMNDVMATCLDGWRGMSPIVP